MRGQRSTAHDEGPHLPSKLAMHAAITPPAGQDSTLRLWIADASPLTQNLQLLRNGNHYRHATLADRRRDERWVLALRKDHGTAEKLRDEQPHHLAEQVA